MPQTKPNESFDARRRVLGWLEEQVAGDIKSIADSLTRCLKKGGTVFACGNGGSASQAEHFVAELAGRFKMDRKALPAHALSINSSTVTAVSNDYGFSQVFARQLDGAARSGDCLVALSTSGMSENVVNACQKARQLGMRVFALTGEKNGPISSESDVALKVPDTDTARIQENHLVALHLICQMVEESMFSPAPARPQKV
jgi:D-sedoheptulose 7-phosphate isomerase